MTRSASAPIVELKGVGRTFGGRRVLSDIDLAIDPGEFVVLVGASGCGKSTLLKIIGGLDDGAEGQVSVAPRQATVFQDARLLPWKRVWENVVLGLRGFPAGKRRQEALAALEEVGLTARADAWPLTLSGGEAQRVALARALVRTPDILLLDEPFAALDALTRLKMQRQVIDLWREHRLAALFVTHDVEEAILLADRIVLIEAGRIVKIIEVVLPRPRRPDDRQFAELRKALLADLGVSERPGPAASNARLLRSAYPATAKQR